MSVNRREFLQILTASATGLYAFDLDKLLWVPGQKKIFIPPERKLVYASEVVNSEWNHVRDILKEIYSTDNILYQIIDDKPAYKHETGMYRTVQIFHGYKTQG